MWIQDRGPEQRNHGIGQEMMIVDLYVGHTIRVEERETGIRGIALLVSLNILNYLIGISLFDPCPFALPPSYVLNPSHSQSRIPEDETIIVSS